MLDLLGTSRRDLLDGFDQGVFWPETTPRFDYIQETIQETVSEGVVK